MKLVCATEENHEELLRPSWKERLRPWNGSGNEEKESISGRKRVRDGAKDI